MENKSSYDAQTATTRETVSVQGVIVDKWAYTQAFNGGVGRGMTKERHRIQTLLDELIKEAQTTHFQNHEAYEAAYEYIKYKIEEKYLSRKKQATQDDIWNY